MISLSNHPISPQSQSTTAQTAHLIGPGKVHSCSDRPIWQPLEGATLELHPRYLRHIFGYGKVEITNSALDLLWNKGIIVIFLNQHGDRIRAKIQPVGSYPNLARLHHLAAQDQSFSLQIARQTVTDKLTATLDLVRYYQRQGKGEATGDVIGVIKQALTHVAVAPNLDTLRGFEGQSAAAWFRLYAELIPDGWSFPRRSFRPPADPVNALLSLGYSLAASRCTALLAAYDLDPLVGFLHEIRSGRPSLACDIMEPLRVPLVDRMVMNMLARRQLTEDSFTGPETNWRLQPDAFKQFIKQFEIEFNGVKPGGTDFRQQTCQRIEQLSRDIRKQIVAQSKETPDQ